MTVERVAGSASLIDVFDRVLDKGIVIAWARVSPVGTGLITVEARVVSIDPYLQYSTAVGQIAPAVRLTFAGAASSKSALPPEVDDNRDIGGGSGGASGATAVLEAPPEPRRRRPSRPAKTRSK